MDLDKLAQHIKISMAYVTTLKNENETLQNKITSLEKHNSTLGALLKEREQSHNDLLNQKDVNENNVLDKIISLQMDQKLKREHKNLTAEHEDLQIKFKEAERSHEETVTDYEMLITDRVRELKEEHEKETEKMREQQEKKEKEVQEEMCRLKERISEMERERAEERTKMQLEFEEKLHNVQRAAVSTHNIDVYKRKLAAQRMEHLHEMQGMRQQIVHLQTAATRGGRGRKRGY